MARSKTCEICDSVDYGYTQSASEAPIGPKFLRITDIVGGPIDWDKVPFCEVHDPAKAQYKLEHGDIVIARTGATTGVSAYVANPPDAVFASYLVRLKVGRRASARFTSYFLRSPYFWEYIRGVLGDKSAQPNASARTMTQARLRLPPINEQEAVAQILGRLDDKIELNRRMNETLEAMARAIFKSWFVDFDPVRAKAESRKPYGMDAEIAALFPCSFQDSPLGKIPRGWAIRKLGEVAGVNERTISGDYPHRTIQYVEISSITTGKLLAPTNYEWPEAPSRAKRLVSQGDTIWSCVRPNRKAYLFIHKPAANLVVSTGFAVLTPKLVVPTYLYAWVTTEGFVDYLAYNADGSAYPAVRPDRFSDSQILVPSPVALEKFEKITGPLRDRIAQNDNEARTLAAIRDALLPKLISGELRVSDEKTIIKECRA